MRLFVWSIYVIFGIPRLGRFFLRTTASARGMDCQKVNFYSRKCKKAVLLSGRYFASPGSDRCVIIAHGYGRHWNYPEPGLFEIVKFLSEHKFNVLVFDFRAHGESGGRRISVGYYETYDLLGARDFLVNDKKIPPQNIALMGFSFGAMVSVLAASKERFGALIVDSAPVLNKAIRGAASFLFHIKIGDINVREAAKKIAIPMLVIYGRRDIGLFTSSKELRFLKKSHPLDMEWSTDAGHIESYSACPEEYLQKIFEFSN